MVKFKVHLIQNDDLDGDALETGALGFHFLPALDALNGIVFPLPCYQHRIDFAVSGEEKAAKPDSRLFHILLERYKIAAGTALYIDDNADNITTAKQLGVTRSIFTTRRNCGRHCKS